MKNLWKSDGITTNVVAKIKATNFEVLSTKQSFMAMKTFFNSGKSSCNTSDAPS